MPIFEFQCEICGKEFERLVFSSDEPIVTCPQCGSEKNRKLLSKFSCSGIERSLSHSCGTRSGSS